MDRFVRDIVDRMRDSFAPIISNRIIISPIDPPGERHAMDEATWLTSNDPQAMLEYLRLHGLYITGGGGCLTDQAERKLRLFACACCRQVWDKLRDEWSRRAIIVAERHYDGEDDSARITVMYTQAHRVPGAEMVGPVMAAAECCNPYAIRAVQLPTCDQRVKAALLRDIFGNPFRPVTIERSELGGSGVWIVSGKRRQYVQFTETVLRLAQAIYDNRDWAAMPAIADAIEEAGAEVHGCIHCGYGAYINLDPPCACMHNEIVLHLRYAGPHVRGCHVLDAILGKS